MTPAPRTESTLITSLAERLRACRLTSQGIAPPAAILWTDPGREWTPLLPDLRAELPELLTLGDFDADAKTGPAIWLRCVLEPLVEFMIRGTLWLQRSGHIRWIPSRSSRTALAPCI